MKALYAGSFDPFTLGHDQIAHRAKKLFTHLVIGIAYHFDKNPLFTPEERAEMVEGFETVLIPGVVVEYAKEKGFNYLVRGVRTGSDFDHELSLARMNEALLGIETILIMADASHGFIESRHVRELIRCKRDISLFVPQHTASYIHDHPSFR